MISPVSETALLVTLANDISQNLPARLRVICQKLNAQEWPWLVDLVPSYTTLLIIYDANQLDFRQATAAIKPFLASWPEDEEAEFFGRRTISLPVYYSAESGPDLESLAQACSLSVEEVIQKHTAMTYQVFAMGFAPGFAFMGEVDPCIAHPRRDTPRKTVPAGSVGIANRQTAVYPVDSPGGWQLIGRCPTTLFDRDHLSLLATGDQIRFYRITRDEYLDLGARL